MTVRVAVFASGTGTNLQSLIDRLNGPPSAARRDAPRATAGPAEAPGERTGARVALVVSDRDDAYALVRASEAGVPRHVVDVGGRDSGDIANETTALLRAHGIDLIALAGYLRLVPDEMIRLYRGRIMNIHPALLPAFGGKGMYGMRVHRAVLEAGCRVTGVTVHHVDERYDEGRPIIQWPVPVLAGDSPEALAARVLEVEHVLYPLTVEWLARRLARAEKDDVTSPPARHGTAASTFTLAEATRLEADIRRVLDDLDDTGAPQR